MCTTVVYVIHAHGYVLRVGHNLSVVPWRAAMIACSSYGPVLRRVYVMMMCYMRMVMYLRVRRNLSIAPW